VRESWARLFNGMAAASQQGAVVMGREATVSGRFDVGFRLPLTSPKSSAPPFGSTHKNM
jgi:hypothetical protein